MTWIQEHLQDIFGIIGMVIALCAAIAALTPSPKDDAILAKVRRVIDFLGFNFSHAENVRRDGPFRR